MARIFKSFFIFLLALLGALALWLVWMTLNQYQPAPVERLEVKHQGRGVMSQVTLNSLQNSHPLASLNQPIHILTWNIGYAGLDAFEDFFMDGGKGVRPDNAAIVQYNLDAMLSALLMYNSDIVLLQEVDERAKRSYFIDEVAFFDKYLGNDSSFAYNFKTRHVPVPLGEPIGSVASGLYTNSKLKILSSSRVALPVPFGWPSNVFNLKRALLVSRLPISGSDKQLVVINLHLDAYEKSGGRQAQTQKLIELAQHEYAQGNYVVAGGDWNQLLHSQAERIFPQIDDKIWNPPYIDPQLIPPSWQWGKVLSKPSSRVNNQPYRENMAGTQLHIIDGFLLSPNITIKQIRLDDRRFRHSDHNPVLLSISLNP